MSGVSQPSSIIQKISRVFEKFENICLALSGGLISVIAVITIVSVSGRFLFNSPLKGDVEIEQLLLLGIIWLAMAGTERVGEHVSMDTLLAKLKKSGSIFSRPLQAAVAFLSALAVGFCLWFAMERLGYAFTSHEKTGGPLYLIFWPAYGTLVLGMILLFARFAIRFVQTFYSSREY